MSLYADQDHPTLNAYRIERLKELEAENAALRSILSETDEVLSEIKRLDGLKEEYSKKMSDLAKRSRAGEDVRMEAESLRSGGIVDYGDVWVKLKHLTPKVKKALLVQESER